MLLTVGQIGRPHGVRGEVSVHVRTDDPEARFAVGAVLTTELPSPRAVPAAAPQPGADGNGGPAPSGVPFQVPGTLTIESVRSHQGRLLIQFAGLSDRDLAEALRGVLLCVDSAELTPPEDPDEFHDHQLVGLAAVTPSGDQIGEVLRVDHAPASDLLVLRRPEGGTALIPFVRQIVPEVDLPGGRVVVDPPSGLLDL